MDLKNVTIFTPIGRLFFSLNETVKEGLEGQDKMVEVGTVKSIRYTKETIIVSLSNKRKFGYNKLPFTCELL